MKAETIDDLAAFRALKEEWNALALRSSPSPLVRHEWFDAAFAHLYSRGANPLVFVVRENGCLRAAAALVSLSSALSKRLTIPGGAIIHEPCGFIYDSEEALSVLTQAVFKSQSALALPRFGRDGPEARLFKKFSPKDALRLERCGRNTYRVPLKPTWQEFETSISRGRRSDMRSYRRRAEQRGYLTFEVVSPSAANFETAFDELLRVEASGWKGREKTAISCDARQRGFYTHYAKAAAQDGMLRFFFLRANGKTIAARMAVEYGNRLWDLRIGYDETWSRCAPGVLLTQETLRYAVERGLEGFEFLGKAESWERHWPCEEDTYVSMRFYPFSAVAQWTLVLDAGEAFARKAVSTTREWHESLMTQLRKRLVSSASRPAREAAPAASVEPTSVRPQVALAYSGNDEAKSSLKQRVGKKVKAAYLLFSTEYALGSADMCLFGAGLI